MLSHKNKNQKHTNLLTPILNKHLKISYFDNFAKHCCISLSLLANQVTNFAVTRPRLGKIILYSHLQKRTRTHKHSDTKFGWASWNIKLRQLLKIAVCISFSLLAYQVANFAVTRPLTFYLLMQQQPDSSILQSTKNTLEVH